MPLMQLKFQPGVVKDRTVYSSSGTWVDCNLVRFREGLPEKWEGWADAYPGFEFEGYCRSLLGVQSYSGTTYYGVGTNTRFYVINEESQPDVTPLEDAVTLGSNPLAVVSGQSTITITHTAHGRAVGDVMIISGSTSVGGIANTVINAEHTIASFIDDNTYTISVGATASSTTSGGGASVQLSYFVKVGDQDQSVGVGWGSYSYGEEVFGGDPAVEGSGRMGIWSQVSWGEDIVANVQNGGIYYWDATNPADRLVDILDLPSADGNAPITSSFIAMSYRDRHLLAFACTEFGTANVNPMVVRWCSQEDITNWNDADTTGTAGSITLSSGSKLLSAKVTHSEVLIWSDTTLYSMQYIGAPYIYGVNIVDSNISISGLKSPVSHGGAVFWCGPAGFYAYDGSVKKIPCQVWDYVFRDANWSQKEKIFGSSNKKHNEVIWFYQSNSSTNDVDKYVALSIDSGAWTIGTLSRTYWTDSAFIAYPMAAGDDNRLYIHNYGDSDGSTDPPSAMNAYIESAPIELSSEGSFDKGDRMMFIRKIYPDIHSNSAAALSDVYFSLKMMDKPGGGFGQTSSSQVTPSAIIPVQIFTDECHVRLRGRSMTLRVESNGVNSSWRLGVPRIDVRPDGQR